MNEAASKRWATRRRKYGSKGHRGYRNLYEPKRRIEAMEAYIIEQTAAGLLSEGQCVKLTGFQRVEVRRRIDELQP